MKWTKELLQELKEMEDAVYAYNHNYYDTHDLFYIRKNLEDYMYKLEKYKKYLLDKDYGFWAYTIKNKKLFLNIKKDE